MTPSAGTLSDPVAAMAGTVTEGMGRVSAVGWSDPEIELDPGTSTVSSMPGWTSPWTSTDESTTTSPLDWEIAPLPAATPPEAASCTAYVPALESKLSMKTFDSSRKPWFEKSAVVISESV